MPGSRSSRHLKESGRATLVFADAELCLYVKVEALPLPGRGRCAGPRAVRAVVRDVLEDRAEGEEAGARLSSGLVIAWPGDAQATADHQARVRSALRD